MISPYLTSLHYLNKSWFSATTPSHSILMFVICLSTKFDLKRLTGYPYIITLQT